MLNFLWFIELKMGISNKLRTLFRGEIPLYHLPHEYLRRRRAAARLRLERANCDEIARTPARLTAEFAQMNGDALLSHFRDRKAPFVWPPEFEIEDEEKESLIEIANSTADNSTWELMGFGKLKFASENVWRRDPLSGHDWGVEHHADTILARSDGSDVRVLWELNRFGHVVPLALSFSITNDEKYAETFFSQIESWTTQNPYARGANWACAMEVALRACNLLAAFDIFRRSGAMTSERLAIMLRLFDQHGRFIIDNNEFSYIATSNHYLSDVVGLFWVGMLMPELENGADWCEFGRKEMLNEMDKQVLGDGADFEASTGYHLFVTEMFDASFRLAEANDIEIDSYYREKLASMHDYLAAITRPDGAISLVGDCDGSRFLPALSEPTRPTNVTDAFPNAGIYVFRHKDLYLHFNASDCGVNGRGSHAHNDALSIEISAFERPFIVDPGSYVYNLDREGRHTFRSTAYHSTVMIDGVEQNTINVETPFVIGNEASPRVVEWSSSETNDRVVAEQYGYRRLSQPTVHRRVVDFDKTDRYWIIEDRFDGEGRHEFTFSFHIAPGLNVDEQDGMISLTDDRERSLLILPIGIDVEPVLEPAFFSHSYGHKEDSNILKWTLNATAPLRASFVIMPSGPDDNSAERLELLNRIADNSN